MPKAKRPAVRRGVLLRRGLSDPVSASPLIHSDEAADAPDCGPHNQKACEAKTGTRERRDRRLAEGKECRRVVRSNTRCVGEDGRLVRAIPVRRLEGDLEVADEAVVDSDSRRAGRSVDPEVDRWGNNRSRRVLGTAEGYFSSKSRISARSEHAMCTARCMGRGRRAVRLLSTIRSPTLWRVGLRVRGLWWTAKATRASSPRSSAFPSRSRRSVSRRESCRRPPTSRSSSGRPARRTCGRS